MWFIFPQLRGLGMSETARYYGIASRSEAEAYLAHGILGERLRECTRLMIDVEGKTAREVLGSPDDLKFRSSMTLFGAASDDPLFAEALGKYYGGRPDGRTLALLG
jgi:uncharacterized protein (DUF1810 family)